MCLSVREKKELFEEFKGELSKPVEIKVCVCRSGVELPSYSSMGDAGMDLRAVEDVEIKPGMTVVIPTGLKVVILDGYEVQIRSRSGISLNTPLRIANGVGTIDSGYRGEIGVIMTNTSRDSSLVYGVSEKGNKNGTYVIRKGDRIAQMVLCKYEGIVFKEVSEKMLEESGINRGGGFGSSGIR